MGVDPLDEIFVSTASYAYEKTLELAVHNVPRNCGYSLCAHAPEMVFDETTATFTLTTFVHVLLPEANCDTKIKKTIQGPL